MLLLVLGCAGYGGATVGASLVAASGIDKDDPESWVRAWARVAERVERSADEAAAGGHDVSARRAYLRAFTYWRWCEHLIPPGESGLIETWKRARKCFRKAASLFRPPRIGIRCLRKMVSRCPKKWYLDGEHRTDPEREAGLTHGTKRELVPRHARVQVEDVMRSARVVVVNGPRQAGKTTLARLLQAQLGGSFLTFDDPAILAACMQDPSAFLAAFDEPLFLDEFQRAGDPLLTAIKREVDADTRPGRFILTGSTRFLTVPTIAESLAGRVVIVDLWPLTPGEADRLGPEADAFLPRILDPSSDFTAPSLSALPTRAQYLKRICEGGFPEVRRLAEPGARQRWFRDYVRTVTQRDVPEITKARQLSELPKLLRALAAKTAQQLNVSALANRLVIERQPLARTYIPLLETVYLLRLIPAWSRNLAARVARHPKAYITDTGVAAHLLGADALRLAKPGSPALGPLIETFVMQEILKQAARHDSLGASVHHYRAHDGPEVDVIVETPDGRVAGIEVKASSTVGVADFRHLARLRDELDRLKEPFVRGVVLYLGTNVLPFGDRLRAVPLAALWLPPSDLNRPPRGRASSTDLIPPELPGLTRVRGRW